MNAHPAIAGLILAAGESQRMGRDKALLMYGGQTFLETIIVTLHEAGIERVAVVLGHHAEQIQQALRLEGADVVVNRNYLQGQTSSLQAGLGLLQDSQPAGVLLCLVDHPGVSVDTVRKLITAFRDTGKAVVIPAFNGKRGHPVLISRALFKELMDLSPDEGANSVVRKYSDRTHLLAVDDPGVVHDIDDPESYRGLDVASK